MRTNNYNNDDQDKKRKADKDSQQFKASYFELTQNFDRQIIYVRN